MQEQKYLMIEKFFFLWRVDSILTGHYRGGWIVLLNKNGRETWSAVKYMCNI